MLHEARGAADTASNGRDLEFLFEIPFRYIGDNSQGNRQKAVPCLQLINSNHGYRKQKEINVMMHQTSVA